MVGSSSSSVCKPCPLGTYSGSMGATSCSPCPAGSYCNGEEDQLCSREGATCTFAGVRQIAYVQNPNSVLATTTFKCTNSIFGDPLPNSFKSCYQVPFSSGPMQQLQLASHSSNHTLVHSRFAQVENSGSLKKLCDEYESACAVTAGTKLILYSASLYPSVPIVTAEGSIECSNGAFSSDPSKGAAKSCYVLSTGAHKLIHTRCGHCAHARLTLQQAPR